VGPTEGGPTLVVLAAGRARRYGGCKPLAPVGPAGEPVIDLLASDALHAGFAKIVLVVSPATGPAIRYHVERQWPAGAPVHFALQEAPIGTVHAVLSAGEHLPDGRGFGVANADDLYGAEALGLLAAHLSNGSTGGATGAGDRAATRAGGNALVAFRLKNAVIGDAPVTRGVCRVDEEGYLAEVVERRQVFPLEDGRFVSKDGVEPAELDGDALVSMNLWAFGTRMRDALQAAMDEAQASEEAEVLLPEVVGRALAGEPGGGVAPDPFKVLASEARVVGVTHPEDLPLVQSVIATDVGLGRRPAALWGTLGT